MQGWTHINFLIPLLRVPSDKPLFRTGAHVFELCWRNGKMKHHRLGILATLSHSWTLDGEWWPPWVIWWDALGAPKPCNLHCFRDLTPVILTAHSHLFDSLIVATLYHSWTGSSCIRCEPSTKMICSQSDGVTQTRQDPLVLSGPRLLWVKGSDQSGSDQPPMNNYYGPAAVWAV